MTKSKKGTTIWISSCGSADFDFWGEKPTVFDKELGSYPMKENAKYRGNFCRFEVEDALKGTGVRFPRRNSKQVTSFIVIPVEAK